MAANRKTLLVSIFLMMVVVLAGVSGYYWYENTYFVSTEDARIAGDIVKVYPLLVAKLAEVRAAEGQKVVKGEVLARQELNNLPDSSAEQTLLRAPVDGIIIRKQGTEGEVATPGQAVFWLVDPHKLYVSANIEETKISRIKPGQLVEVTLDLYPGRTFNGRVQEIGQATTATFSVLPQTTSSNFTKVTQKVPVKIQLTDLENLQLIPGTSAVVKIRVR
ncbi:HlyD family secretion protein [Carboxydocella sp. ULO1]|uniref:HlyD family secretion protein n=1 Tax=Carboxydocella sp. ULO1 TaxID=1926599 RepID=UPI0009AD0327|nr:efflux RND transporter periplasmic adaptor subunit [Carboxydocella sp. ULO1]GAW29427.1 hemolysin D [Carboxydocella sp. ULO1]